jgi:hypothetical protein
VERGDLFFSASKLPLSRIQAHSRSGDIRVALPPAAQFGLNATTDNGDISNEFGAPLKVEQNGRRATLSGNVGSGPSIELETRRGQIVLQKAAASKPLGQKPEVSGATRATPPLQKLEQ